jgi:hypothetical protein
MTAIVETSTYTPTITQLETSELVLGGVGGPSNRALVEIANRTKWLYDRVQSLTEQPAAALAFPTIATADNRLTVTPSAATAGGKVSIAAGTRLTLAEEVVSAETGRLRTFTTASYLSADLLVSSTYYLRAQVDVSGNLAVYVQRGTDADTIPAGLRGTPDAASGGGFDSTVFDMLIAKVVTGTAGTLPTVTALRNAHALRHNAQLTLTGMASGDNASLAWSFVLNWSRAPAMWNVIIDSIASVSFTSFTVDVDRVTGNAAATVSRYAVNGTTIADFIDAANPPQLRLSAMA